MKRALVLVLPLALLASCTEQDICVWRNTADLRQAESRIGELEGNIARGYAIHTSTETYQYTGVCHDRDGKPYECTKTDTRTVEVPVEIDIPDQRRQLAELTAKLPALQAAAETAKTQCRQLYPE